MLSGDKLEKICNSACLANTPDDTGDNKDMPSPGVLINNNVGVPRDSALTPATDTAVDPKDNKAAKFTTLETSQAPRVWALLVLPPEP